MAAHSESKPGLAHAGTFGAGNDQRGRIQKGGEVRKPRFVIVLRTKISKHRIGHVALEQFRGPALPLEEQSLQSFKSMITRVTPEKFGGRRRRTCASIEQYDVHLSTRECLIDDRQITQHQRQKTEA